MSNIIRLHTPSHIGEKLISFSNKKKTTFILHSIRDNALFFRKCYSITKLDKFSESRWTTSLHLTRNTNPITKVFRKETRVKNEIKKKIVTLNLQCQMPMHGYLT